MCPHGTQTIDSCAMHCKLKHMKSKSMNQNVNALFKNVSFDTASACLLKLMPPHFFMFGIKVNIMVAFATVN